MKQQTKKEMKAMAKNIADAIESSFGIYERKDNKDYDAIEAELVPEVWTWWHAEADSMSYPGASGCDFPKHILTVNKFLELAGGKE